MATNDTNEVLKQILAVIQKPRIDGYFDLTNTKYGFVSSDAATKGIDYSEIVTVPDAVLSMKEIYEKYVVNGQIAGLSNNTLPLISSDCPEEYANETEFEERLDYLRISQEANQSGLRKKQEYDAAAAEALANQAKESEQSPAES